MIQINVRNVKEERDNMLKSVKWRKKKKRERFRKRKREKKVEKIAMKSNIMSKMVKNILRRKIGKVNLDLL
jgi:hypothetical protein